jgi:hypothetical protein
MPARPKSSANEVPIAVPPWLHRVMIREHGPANSTAKLCLFVVNSFLDDDGCGWPSQKAIAEAACLVEKTAQRCIAQAIDEGWLGAAATYGRKWKLYQYRAAVPDQLANCQTMTEGKIVKLIDNFIAKNGPIAESARPFKRAPKVETIAPDVPVLNPNVPVLKSNRTLLKRGDVPVLKSFVPAQDGTKFSSEVLMEVPIEVLKEGAVASDSTAIEDVLDSMPARQIQTRAERIALAMTALKKGLDQAFIRKQFPGEAEEVLQSWRRTA